jgi:hypothetical protein
MNNPQIDRDEKPDVSITDLIARAALEVVSEDYVLKSWGGLFEILNEYYPEDIFPTLPDDEGRDSGPRIISLIRLLDRERKRAEWQASREVEVTAEMVERAAKACHKSIWETDSWDGMNPAVQDSYRKQARSALSAALGGEHRG